MMDFTLGGILAGTGILGIGLVFAKKIGLKIACNLVEKYLPDEKLKEWGKPLAVGATEFMTEKFGKGWNKLENLLQHKLNVFLKAANTGLDSDDS